MSVILRLSGDNMNMSKIASISPFSVTAIHEKKIYNISLDVGSMKKDKDSMNIEILDGDLDFDVTLDSLVSLIQENSFFFNEILSNKDLGVLESEFDIDVDRSDDAVQNLLISSKLLKTMNECNCVIDLNITLYN